MNERFRIYYSRFFSLWPKSLAVTNLLHIYWRICIQTCGLWKEVYIYRNSIRLLLQGRYSIWIKHKAKELYGLLMFPPHERPSQEIDYYVLFLRIQQIFCHKRIGIMLDLSYIFFGYTFSLSLSLSLSLSHSKIKLSIEFEWNLVSNRVIKPMRLSVKVLLC